MGNIAKGLRRSIACRSHFSSPPRNLQTALHPGIDLGIAAFTESDRRCLQFALEQGVDAVSQSFVESRRDIQAVRQALASLGFRPFIIAKIERSRALAHIDETSSRVKES